MFDGIKKVLARARDTYAETQDAVRAKRAQLAALNAMPHARAEILRATELAIENARDAALAELRERGARLGSPMHTLGAPGALPTDERGRPVITQGLLLALLAQPLQELVREGLQTLPQGITSDHRAVELVRINGEIASLEAKLTTLRKEADAAGVNL